MAQEIMFSGDELELLNALDRSGCVLTDDGKFTCSLQNDKLPMCLKGEYASVEKGWKLTYRIAPAPRMTVIGGIFALLFLVSLISFARTGVFTGAVLFGILLVAMVVNYTGQKKDALKRFENSLLRGTDYIL